MSVSEHSLDPEGGDHISIDDHSVALPDLRSLGQAPSAYASHERDKVVQTLYVRAGRPDKTTQSPSNESLIERLDLFLNWLDIYGDDTNVNTLKLRTALDLMSSPRHQERQRYFTPGHQRRAARLLSRLNGAANTVVADDIEDDSETGASDGEGDLGVAAADSTDPHGGAVSSLQAVAVRLPGKSHPIFGTCGVMFGIAISKLHRKTYILDPRYVEQKRNASVFGHNDHQVGDWWPLQIAALFNGAHAGKVRGIAGNSQHGAFSIVASGYYHDLDRDEGEVLHYSGSKSHDNTSDDAVAPRTKQTALLVTSQATGRPVRVLRSANKKSIWAPDVGIRYDGLYQVVGMSTKKNKKGGLYEQFKLQRLGGQPDLSDIVKTVPSAAQKALSAKVALGY